MEVQAKNTGSVSADVDVVEQFDNVPSCFNAVLGNSLVSILTHIYCGS